MTQLKKETKSNWECVSLAMQEQKELELGLLSTSQFYQAPEELLASLCVYKFAAKMFGKRKSILDASCKEGLGSYLLAKECGATLAIDPNETSILSAKANFEGPSLEFKREDFLSFSEGKTYDGILSVNLFNQLSLEQRSLFWERLIKALSFDGLAIIAFSLKDDFSKKSFKEEMKKHFINVFFFGLEEGRISYHLTNQSSYLIALGGQKK